MAKIKDPLNKLEKLLERRLPVEHFKDNNLVTVELTGREIDALWGYMRALKEKEDSAQEEINKAHDELSELLEDPFSEADGIRAAAVQLCVALVAKEAVQ